MTHLRNIRCLSYNALILGLAIVASSAQAQSSVKFSIAESSRLLEAALELERGEITQPDFDMVVMAESCMNPSMRLQYRNRPWIMVQNTSNPDDDIVTVTIDLTENGFEFGNGDMVGDGFNGLLSMLSSRSDSGVSLDSVGYGADNSELELNFSGLAMGRAAIFRVDLDEPGGSLMFPDYREVIMGADTGSGPGSQAMFRTEFASGAKNTSMFARPSGILSTSGLIEPYHGQTMSSVTPSTTIPEPSSLLLLLAGIAGMGATRRVR